MFLPGVVVYVRKYLFARLNQWYPQALVSVKNIYHIHNNIRYMVYIFYRNKCLWWYPIDCLLNVFVLSMFTSHKCMFSHNLPTSKKIFSCKVFTKTVKLSDFKVLLSIIRMRPSRVSICIQRYHVTFPLTKRGPVIARFWFIAMHSWKVIDFLKIFYNDKSETNKSHVSR